MEEDYLEIILHIRSTFNIRYLSMCFGISWMLSVVKNVHVL